MPLSPAIFNSLIEPLALAFRSHPQIRGFLIGQTHHTINLCADHVILLLTNPSISLPQGQDLLAQFSEVSYYKVKCSLILELNLPSETKASLQRSLS